MDLLRERGYVVMYGKAGKRPSFVVRSNYLRSHVPKLLHIRPLCFLFQYDREAAANRRDERVSDMEDVFFAAQSALARRR